jgi:hypothetical protein
MGKDLRKRVPRSSHAGWEAPEGRRTPAEVLAEQDATRVPELIQIRRERMLASPFTFFRAGAAIMAADLASTPASGLRVQLCGDAHLSNFGVFAAPDRALVFDLNDFDETHPGPFEWDVKRLGASIAIAGRDRGLESAARTAAVLATARAYRTAIRRLAAKRNLDVWYSRADVEEELGSLLPGMSSERRKAARKNLKKARSKDSVRALSKLTREVGGVPRIISDPPLIVPIEDVFENSEERDIEAELKALLARYRRSLDLDTRVLCESYEYAHAARKVVGVGSVGTRAWIVLLLGRNAADPLFLQVKEAETSALEPFTAKSKFDNQGRRVVEGQRLMQAAGDRFLGWLRAEGDDGQSRDFYVRQLWDGKHSVAVESLDPGELAIYGEVCGRTLARAHAKSGDRAAIAAYLGSGDAFDQAVAAFAEAYADQNDRDFESVI